MDVNNELQTPNKKLTACHNSQGFQCIPVFTSTTQLMMPLSKLETTAKKKKTYFEDALWDNARSAENSLDGKNSGSSETPRISPHKV